MDINQLLAREQMERAFARTSAHAGACAAHLATADLYRGLLDQRRRAAHAHPDATTLLVVGKAAA